ncbi:hypothetical protein B0H16DRAFT_809307 [Mycena metata]|uniref:Uncharacterized protein n=1 Tax=Mycena metata TaxID=1033252 RepID=A0AAD7K6C3_9AGAR|nr:hypothetical protein B0H16DRAFT_809307 [Mycena metata]
MQLGNPDVHAPQIVDNDLKRFMLDVSSAWNGQLALTPPDDAAGTDLPSYSILSPADPHSPASSAHEPVHYPPKSRSLGGSKISSKSSSLGRPQASTFMSAESPTAAFAALGAAHAQRWLAMNSPPSRTPPSSLDPEKALPPVPPSRSPMDNVQEFLDLWNQRYFHPRNLEAFMVPRVGPSGAAEFAVNLVSRPWPYRPSADPGPTSITRTRSNTKASSDESEPGRH